MNKKNLVWTGAVMDPSGYGEASRGYLGALHGLKTDINIKIKPRYFFNGQSVGTNSSWLMLKSCQEASVDRSLPHVYLQHLTPDLWHIGYGAKTWHVGMTTFETDRLPPHWLMQMRAMDEIWTFSRWSKDVMEDSGIRNPIFVIPHGVNTNRFAPKVPPMDCLGRGVNKCIGKDTYVFGSNFDWTERKNPRALLKAYLTRFKYEDDVVLVLKAYHQYPLERSKMYIRGYIDQVKEDLGLTSAKTPPILLLPPIIAPGMVPSFYASLNCYVLPSRGEGWGLTFSEAMATGLPTIGVNWSGNTQFMDDENSLLINNYKLVEVTPSAAGYQRQYIGHQWADCDVDELGDKMHWAYTNQNAAREIGERARLDMVARFTWASAAHQAKARLDQIYQGIL